MILKPILIAAWLSFPLFLSVPSVAAQPADDWTVVSDETLERATKTVSGDVRVMAPATLRVLGSDLQVGGDLFVERGARLLLGPSDGVPTRLSPADAAKGLTILIQGTIESAGLPRTHITGLSGAGLMTVVSGEDGFQIRGTADLSDLHVQRGRSGLSVQEGGALTLRASLVEQTGEFGIAALGRVNVVDSIVRDVSMGVTGRETCSLELVRTEVEAFNDAVLVNSCSATLRGSRTNGSSVAVTGTGRARLTIEDSLLEGFRVDGVSATAQDEVRPWLTMRNVTLRGGPGAQRGVYLMGAAEAVLDRVDARGFNLSGVDASGSKIRVSGSTFQGNDRYGIWATGGFLELLGGNDYGLAPGGTPNGKGAAVHVAKLRAVAADEKNRLIPAFDLEIYGNEPEPVYSGNAVEGGVASVLFATYSHQPDGPQFRGPFTYRLRSPALGGRILTGPVEDVSTDLIVRAGPVGGLDVADWLGPGLVLAGGLIVAVAVFPRRVLRSMRRLVVRPRER